MALSTRLNGARKERPPEDGLSSSYRRFSARPANPELMDIDIAKERALLGQLFGARSFVLQDVDAAVLIRRIDQAVVKDREWPHPYVLAVAEILDDVFLGLGHEDADLQRQRRVGDIPGAETRRIPGQEEEVRENQQLMGRELAQQRRISGPSKEAVLSQVLRDHVTRNDGGIHLVGGIENLPRRPRASGGAAALAARHRVLRESARAVAARDWIDGVMNSPKGRSLVVSRLRIGVARIVYGHRIRIARRPLCQQRAVKNEVTGLRVRHVDAPSILRHRHRVQAVGLIRRLGLKYEMIVPVTAGIGRLAPRQGRCQRKARDRHAVDEAMRRGQDLVNAKTRLVTGMAYVDEKALRAGGIAPQEELMARAGDIDGI